ncbi:MAG: hypothetical protein AAF485_23840 [Chloroflexota bacterium]
MRAKLFIFLFLTVAGTLWAVGPAGAVDEYDSADWIEGCTVNPEAEKNLFINEFGEKIYYNVDQKVLWDL